MFYKRFLAFSIAKVHAAHLWNGDVRFVDHAQPIIFFAPGDAAKIIQQAIRALTRGAAVEVAAVIFNAAAEASLEDHFQVVLHTALQTLRLHQLSRRAQFKNTRSKILAHLGQGFLNLVLGHHVMLCWKNKSGDFLG